jgi:hypothetical protein
LIRSAFTLNDNGRELNWFRHHETKAGGSDLQNLPVEWYLTAPV